VPTYIVESYGADGAIADQRARAQLVAELGAGITNIRTPILPGDQTLLHLFEAASAEVLGDAVADAALDCDRIVEVMDAAAGVPIERGSR
jgi:hypothetical protein